MNAVFLFVLLALLAFAQAQAGLLNASNQSMNATTTTLSPSPSKGFDFALTAEKFFLIALGSVTVFVSSFWWREAEAYVRGGLAVIGILIVVFALFFFS